jgi:hypothetical protein
MKCCTPLWFCTAVSLIEHIPFFFFFFFFQCLRPVHPLKSYAGALSMEKIRTGQADKNKGTKIATCMKKETEACCPPLCKVTVKNDVTVCKE